MLRTLGWTKITRQDYGRAYETWGGSVITHPHVLDFIHAHKPTIDHAYYASADFGRPHMALCRWGRWVAGDIQALKRMVLPDLDLGEPEVILPMAPDSPKRYLWLRGQMLSDLNAAGLRNSQVVGKPRNHIAQVKGHGPGGLSSKTKNSRRRQWKLMQAAGGHARPVSDFSPGALTDIYRTLHRLRHGKEIAGASCLPDLFAEMSDHVFGSVLFMKDRPCAFQLVLRARSPRWISYEYINGGLDPEQDEWSPGTVLLWLNTLQAWEECHQASLAMRYSFGRNRGDYKQAWCQPQAVFRLLTL